jgi:hypothetical protein
MKLKTLTLAALSAFAITGGAHAAIVMVAEYRLGEAGSIGGTIGTSSSTLIDSATGGAPSGTQNVNSVSGLVPSGTVIGTEGVYAPGSTHFLDTNGNSGWFSSTSVMSPLAPDNFAFGIYARAASLQQGDIFTLGGSNGSFSIGMNTNGWAASSRNVSWIGGNNGVSGSFTANQWVHLALVRTAGNTTFYINGVAQGSTFGGAPVHNFIHMAVNPGGTGYFDGQIDEARVLTFDAADAGVNNINVINALTIPEPSTALLSGLGILGLLRRRRK